MSRCYLCVSNCAGVKEQWGGDKLARVDDTTSIMEVVQGLEKTMQNHCEHQLGESPISGISSEEGRNGLQKRGVDETLVLAVWTL